MYLRTLNEILNGIWAIEKSRADGYMPLVLSLIKGDFKSQVNTEKENPIQYMENLVNLRNSARTINANDNLKCKK